MPSLQREIVSRPMIAGRCVHPAGAEFTNCGCGGISCCDASAPGESCRRGQGLERGIPFAEGLSRIYRIRLFGPLAATQPDQRWHRHLAELAHEFSCCLVPAFPAGTALQIHKCKDPASSSDERRVCKIARILLRSPLPVCPGITGLFNRGSGSLHAGRRPRAIDQRCQC